MQALNALMLFALTSAFFVQIIPSDCVKILDEIFAHSNRFKVPPSYPVWNPMKSLAYCLEKEILKEEFYRRDDKGRFIKLRTQFSCRCDGHRIKPKKKLSFDDYIPDPGNPEQYLVNYECHRDQWKESKIRECNERDECQYDILSDYGEEKPGVVYFDYIDKRCRCEGLSSCVFEVEETFRIQYSCREMLSVPRRGSCAGVFKREYHERNNSSQELVKLDTGFFCRCHDTTENYTSLPPFQYPMARRLWSIDFKCPIFQNDPYKNLISCHTGEICKVLQYHDFGRDRIGMKYEDFTLEKCRCDRHRECVAREIINEENRGIHYCEYKNYNYSILKQCDDKDIYMEKIYLPKNDTNSKRDGVKMDTKIRCQCDPVFQKPVFIRPLKDTAPGQYKYLYKCAEKEKKRKIIDCLEHQVCRRDFLYDYGKDRGAEQYVENVEIYCNCANGMECKQVSEVPKNYWIKPYDKVHSSRCMKPESGEKNKPCKPNQTYMEVIYRNESITMNYFEVIRLNTYIKCICDYTDESNLGENVTRNDPFLSHQWISAFSCPSSRIPKPRENISCKDYAICRRGVRYDVGVEDPDRLYTHHFKSYCECDQEQRSCENVGRDGYDVVYRCINKKSRMKKEICKGNDIYRVDIYEHQCFPSDPTKALRLNTFVECICTGADLRKKTNSSDKDPNYPLHVITKHICPRYHEVESESAELPYCSYQELCSSNNYLGVGLEKPLSIFQINSTISCICTLPRECVYNGDPTLFSHKHRCVVGDTEQVLPICEFNELYKEEIYANVSTSNGEYRLTKNTILNCLCESTFYSIVHEEESRNKREIVTRNHKKFYCPAYDKYSTENVLDPCLDYAICRRDTYTEYGEDVGPGIKYQRNQKVFCECNLNGTIGNRSCSISEKDYPKDSQTTNNTYRCLETDKEELKLLPCEQNQDFLVVVLNNTTKEVLNTFKRCKCSIHDNSYEALNYTNAIDPADPNQLIRTYQCSQHSKQSAKPTCEENKSCYEERYLPYGREREGNFLFTSYEPCMCSKTKECTDKGIVGGGRIASFKCEGLEVCQPLRNCRRLVYYTAGLPKNPLLKRNETVCICNGVCLIESQQFISEKFGTTTLLGRCFHVSGGLPPASGQNPSDTDINPLLITMKLSPEKAIDRQ